MGKRILAVVLVLFSSLALAATEDVQQQSRGYGSTYQDALASALLGAVRQVRGLSVGEERRVERTLVESVSGFGYAAITADTKVVKDITTQSEGWVKTFEVTEVKKPAKEGDQWEVAVLATIPKYVEAIEGDTRKTFAALPLDVADVPASQGSRRTANDIAERIAEGVRSEVNQSGKLAVVNRGYSAQFGSEHALLRSTNVSPEEASRLGRQLGADFIMVGKIHKLTVKNEGKNFYGMQGAEYDIELYFQVVETATGKLIWSDTVDDEFTSLEEDVITDLVNRVSRMIVINMYDEMFPIRIIDLQGKEAILLSQGGKRFEVGQIMEVHTPGRTIKDPDNSMPITVEGKKLAELEVIDVKPKYAVTKLVSGNYSELEKGALVRRVEDDRKPKQELTPGSSDKPWTW